MCAAGILNTHIDIDKMPNEYKLPGKQADLARTAVILISTVKRKKEKCQEIQEDSC